MAPKSAALTTTATSGPSYQLDNIQTLKASKALLKFIHKTEKENAEKVDKRNLLDDDSEPSGSSIPIWLTLTTKNHIVSEKRLKPSKIRLPNPFPLSPDTTICLITADPQRTYKDIISSPAFPAPLAKLITRVISVTKLAAKYSQYEQQRQLKASHDIFLADDRIITRLPKILGKSFYKSTTKRPIPISMQAPAPRSEGKRISRAKGSTDTISPKALAAEIEKTFSMALVAIAPSTNTSVRIGLAGFTAEQIAENVEAASNELITRFVPQKWRGVRAIHIKGPETAALPIWLAEDLWVGAEDVKPEVLETQADDGDKLIADGDAEVGVKAITSAEGANVGKKRKRKAAEEGEGAHGFKRAKEGKGQEGGKINLDQEIALRKQKLKAMKEKAEKDVEDEV